MTDPLGQSQVIPYLSGLSAKGYKVTLLSFEKKDRYNKFKEHIEVLLQNNNIEWAPQFFSSRPPFLSKLYDQWKMKRIAKRLHKQEKFELIHCRSYVAAETGLYLNSKYGIPFLFDMRGFWVDERVDNGQWKLSNPFYKTLYKKYKKKESKYFEKSAHIISLTHTGKDELVNAYKIPAAKVTVIPCCVDLQLFNYATIQYNQQEEKRKLLGLSGHEKVLSYLGSVGGSYLTDEMLQFFLVLKEKHREAKFLFITQNNKEEILSKAAEKGLTPSEIIIQPASRENVPLYLSLSDWSIFFYKDAYSRKACSPTKLGEIMAMGIPVICNDIGDTGQIVKDARAGIVVNGFTATGYEEALASMQHYPIEKNLIREEAYKYFDLVAGINQYANVYHNIL